MMYFSFYAVEQQINHGTQALDFSVTRAGCCKYFIFSIISFFGYQTFAQPRIVQTSLQGATAVHSAKDQ